MFAFLLSPLGKLLAVGGVAFLLGGIAIHTIDNSAYHRLEAKQATLLANANAKALAQVETWARKMNEAASVYVATQNTLNNQIDAIQTELHNVQIRRPLPVNCRPDAERMQFLNAAYAASRAAAVGQRPSR